MSKRRSSGNDFPTVLAAVLQVDKMAKVGVSRPGSRADTRRLKKCLSLPPRPATSAQQILDVERKRRIRENLNNSSSSSGDSGVAGRQKPLKEDDRPSRMRYQLTPHFVRPAKRLVLPGRPVYVFFNILFFMNHHSENLKFKIFAIKIYSIRFISEDVSSQLVCRIECCVVYNVFEILNDDQ